MYSRSNVQPKLDGTGPTFPTSLCPTLFNIYLDELVHTLQNSTAPGLVLQETEIKCSLFADDLVLRSPTKEGLQHSMNILATFCETWVLKGSPQKTQGPDLTKTFQGRGKHQVYN